MKWLVPAVAVAAAMAVCNPASAQTTGDILQRLEALEKSNADLKKENAALRERVRRIESGSQTATSVSTVQSGSTSAQAAAGYAAGAAVRPVYKAAPMGVPAAFSWTGVYLGGHGGFAWARATGPDLHIDQRGGFGGVQMGLNYQFWNHWVIGLESDASFGDIRGSTSLVCGGGGDGGGDGGGGCDTKGTISFKVDAFGTFRERAGYAWDNVLFYETAGVAWAEAKPHIVVTASGDPSQLGSFDDRRLMTGLAAGGGIEVAATSNLTFKVEYLYLDFPQKNFLVGTPQKGSADEFIHTVRAGVNWLFH
jgi:outer membrane immunogenic protein